MASVYVCVCVCVCVHAPACVCVCVCIHVLMCIHIGSHVCIMYACASLHYVQSSDIVGHISHSFCQVFEVLSREMLNTARGGGYDTVRFCNMQTSVHIYTCTQCHVHTCTQMHMHTCVHI